MKKNIFTIFSASMLFALGLTSCKKTLDLTPTNGVTVDIAYSTPEGYKQGFAKLYGAFALTGNGGPSGQPDIDPATIDEGNSDFLRMFWNVQELSTDEAIDNASWNGNTDAGLHDFHNMNWSAGNRMLLGLYARSAYQILLCNEFMRQASDANLARRGIGGAEAQTIKSYLPEARFLRAFQYWVLMDCFGNPSFATENDAIGSVMPKQIKRAELFSYIESELKDIATSLPAPRTNEYGRADQAAAWALLARMYLNAQVYTGTARWADAITYSKKVIDAGYSLVPTYNWLFLNDNSLSKNEFIFTINYDGQKSQNFGGTNYIVWAGSASDVGLNVMGVTGWGGNRTTRNLPNLFPDLTGSIDKRANFFTNGRNVEIVDRISDGYVVTKFKNVNRDGSLGYQLKDLGVGIDMPLFRLAEQYLIYAEAVLRGGSGGDMGTALGYVNALRTRAYGNTNGNIGASQLNLDFIIDERARELYWECHRRTDLIRFNRFTESTYLWPWKGNVANGTGVAPHYKLYPIPSSEISSNNNLVQNPGY
ncbi:MAG: RagB/SusD family nutrient uptake outer membrane protein [Chitinophagaceae bacterium]|nr:MAG: RagB/SusD family nutrient uptake outer membrane protein [Chitinophagaceae bacterium]